MISAAVEYATNLQKHTEKKPCKWKTQINRYKFLAKMYFEIGNTVKKVKKKTQRKIILFI